MAFPSDTFTPTDLAVFIPEIWGKRINDFFKDKQKLSAFFTDRSSEVMGGGDTLYTPGLTQMTAYTKTNGAAVTLNSPTETRVTLVVNQWFEVSFAIEDLEAAQVYNAYPIQEAYIKNAAYTVLNKLEVALATLFNGFSAVVGTTGTDLTDITVRAAIETLATANVDLEDCAFFFHPFTIWQNLMGIDRFVAIDQFGQGGTVKGQVGTLYGIPVVASTNIIKINTNADYCGALAHKDSLHFATANLKGKGARGVRLQSNYIPDYLSTVSTADIAYGVIENRDNAGVKIVSGVTLES